MNKWFFFLGPSVATATDGSPRQRSPWSIPWVLLLIGLTLFVSGCANDAFLPPPENLPYGQTQPDDTSEQPLQKPADL